MMAKNEDEKIEEMENEIDRLNAEWKEKQKEPTKIKPVEKKQEVKLYKAFLK